LELNVARAFCSVRKKLRHLFRHAHIHRRRHRHTQPSSLTRLTTVENTRNLHTHTHIRTHTHTRGTTRHLCGLVTLLGRVHQHAATSDHGHNGAYRGKECKRIEERAPTKGSIREAGKMCRVGKDCTRVECCSAKPPSRGKREKTVHNASGLTDIV
jgi:hypothetical protein